MKKALAMVAAAWILSLGACREEKQAPSVESAPEQAEAAPDSNRPFTPPEIRRAYDSTSKGVAGPDTGKRAVPDTAKLAKAVADTAKPVVAVVTPPPPPQPLPVKPVPAPPAAPEVKAPKTGAMVPAAIPAGLQGPTETGDWVVQVAIHKSEAGAQEKVAKLANLGIPAYVVQAAPNAGLSGSYWRVRVGRFVQRSDAQKYGDFVLKPAGYAFWVDRKANEAPAAGGTP